MIYVYAANAIDFNNSGISPLKPIYCEVEEARNGMFELELEHPFDKWEKWKNLIEGNIIKAPTPTGNQLFRIYKKNKSMLGIRVFARHIFYDLVDNFLEDCRPENADGTGALNRILSSTQYPHRFTSMSDVPGPKTAYFIRKNPVEAIFSDDGILGRWGGELERDNFLIKLLQNRGKDRGVTIRYGKNLLGIDEDLDLDSVVTRVMPQGYDGLFLPEKYVDSPLINNYPHPKIRKIEYSDIKVDEENGITEAMAIEKLKQRAQQEFTINKIDIPVANYKVDFIELSRTEEYKNYAVLERVYLCDTVTVQHLKYGFDIKAKVIRYKYDCLLNRYKEIELGSFKDNTLSSLNSIRNTVNQILQDAVTGTKMQEAIDHATKLLTGALGGNVVFRPKDKPQEILIMDTEDIMTAKSVWRWNLNGLGYSKSGINGPYETAITMDGNIIGTFIKAKSITANQLDADAGQNLVLSSNESVQTMVSTSINNIQISVKNIVKNSKINESSSLYGFGSRDLTVDLIAGKQYTLTVNGRVNAQALTDGKVLKAYLYESTWAYDEPNISIDSTVDVTKSVTFTCTWTGAYRISFYLYPSGGSRLGTATVNWCTLVEGSKALVGWIPAPEDTEQGIKDAKDSANAAQGTADTAKQNAATANTALDNMSSDNKVTPIEKISIKKEFDIIVSEKVKIDSSATTYGVDKTAYGITYTALYNYANPLLTNMTTTQDLTKEGADATGGVTFRRKFKTYYDARQDLLNAISAKAKTLADNAQYLADTAQSLAQAMSLGKMIYTDPTFKNGNNGINVYNNSNNGTVIHTRITKPSDCPTTSTHCLEIKHTGVASPGYGGFQQSIQSRANAKFVVRIIAKIPVGYKLNTASNSMGTGYTDKFITSTEGTGKYEEYVRVVSCGTTGTFSSGGHLYLSGNPTPTSSAPVTWYVAYCTVFDITDTDSISDHERRIYSTEQQITPTAITTKFQESINNVNNTVEAGIIKWDKNGQRISHSNINIDTLMTADGFYIVPKGKDKEQALANFSGKGFGTSSEVKAADGIFENIYLNNNVKLYQSNSITYYVNTWSGDDSQDGLSYDGAFRSFNKALSLIGKYIPFGVTVNIYCYGIFYEPLIITDYWGGGDLHIWIRRDSQLRSGVRLVGNYLRIVLEGQRDWSGTDGTLITGSIAGSTCIDIIRSTKITLLSFRVSGASTGIGAYDNSDVALGNIDLGDCYHGVWGTSSHIYTDGIRGSCTYACVMQDGAVISYTNTSENASMPTGTLLYRMGGTYRGICNQVASAFAAPPKPPVQTYETTWNMTGGKTKCTNSGDRTDGLLQGYYDSSRGQQRALIYFDINSIKSTLTGATINDVQIYAQRLNTAHGTYAGQPVHIWSKSGEGTVTKYGAFGSLTQGVGAWLGGGSMIGLGNQLRDGSADGVMFYDQNAWSQNQSYIRFEWNVQLWIRYTK